MSLDVDQYNNKIQNLLSDIQVQFPVINARLSLSALAMIKNRIINTGTDHTGKQFKKYSTNPLPFFFFENKGLGSGADKKIEAVKKKQSKPGYEGVHGISYTQIRELNGLQTNHVDMQFTGETLRDLDVLETKIDGEVVVTIVGSKNSITKKNGKATITTGKVTEHLAERYGDFLTLSNEETDAIEEAFDNELQTFLDKHFTQ